MRAQLRNRTSAQTGLCKWSLRWCTGGRFGELARRSLRQQGEYHFGEYPASCQIRLLGGQLTEPKQRFEALEQQLDLPAQSIKLQDRLRSIFLRQTRQQENEFGCPQGTRINFLADLKRSSDHLFACDLSLFRRQTSDNQTQFQMGSLRIARIDKNRAAYRIPFDLIESGKQVERFALGREQTKRIPAHANHEIRTTVENERQLARACIIAITQPNIARAPLKSAQPLGPAIVGQFEVIHPTRQIICQVEPVRGAIRAGMADGAGINHAQPASFPCSTDLGARFFDEPARNELEPICGVAESLVKRWPRDLRYSTCLRPGAASNQGIAARIHKRKSQKVAWGFYAPRSEKSFELAGRLIDCDQLADPSQSRGPGTKPESIAHAWRNRSPMVNLKLTPMTPTLSPLTELGFTRVRHLKWAEVGYIRLRLRGEGVRPNLWHRCASTSPERALAQLGTSSFARWADVAIGSSKLVGTLAPWLACDVVTFTPLCIPARRDRRATTVGSLGAVI